MSRCLVLVFCFFSFAGYAEKENKVTVGQLCDKTSSSLKEVRARIASDILPISKERIELLQRIKSGRAGVCGDAILDFLKSSASDSRSVEIEAASKSLLTLALAANMPEALPAIERHINWDSPDEWLDILKQQSPQAYDKSLTGFVLNMGSEVRNREKIATTSPAAYGSTLNDGLERKPVKLSSPLVVERYLQNMRAVKRKPTAQEFSALNALFAASEASYRNVFLTPLSALLRLHRSAWIQSFRSEPVWAQIRLFPLMQRVGGPEVVSELMWLSAHHKDLRVRSLADRTLDTLL